MTHARVLNKSVSIDDSSGFVRIDDDYDIMMKF